MLRYLFCIVCVFSVLGCRHPEEYIAALKAVSKDVPEANKFVQINPASLQTIAHYLQNGKSVYTAQTLLFQRYEFRIDIYDVLFTADYKNVRSHGKILFSLVEVATVDTSSENITLVYGETWTLSLADFQTLCRNNGDFASIGIKLQKTAPVPGIDKYWNVKTKRYL